MRDSNIKQKITEPIDITCNQFSKKIDCSLLLEIIVWNNGQATKSARGMPWHQEPMKDATNCERGKIRGYSFLILIKGKLQLNRILKEA